MLAKGQEQFARARKNFSRGAHALDAARSSCARHECVIDGALRCFYQAREGSSVSLIVVAP
jgi:hypothetical protein